MEVDINFKDIINKIKRLNDKEKHHILYILQKNNIEYTKNSNGYFFNLDKVDRPIIDKINKCVDLIEKNREIIKDLDKKRDMHLQFYKQLIEDKLQETIQLKRKNIQDKLIIQSENDNFTNFIKKKSKKRRRTIPGCDINEDDPDVLMKSYMKSRKITKDSYLYNLAQCISKRKSKQIEAVEESDDINPYTEGDGGDGGDDYIDADVGGDNISEIAGDIGDDLNLEVENNAEDNDADADDTTTHIKHKEKDKDGDKDEDEDDFYSSDVDVEDDIDYDNETIAQTKNEEEELLDYYKNLLKKSHGMEFNDDKYVIMSAPKYIERK
jgi:hypothetical protein